MFRLLRFFSILSLLAFTIVAALLGMRIRQTALRNLTELEENKNVALTQSFANSLWPQFAQHVASASDLSDDELRGHPETARLHEAVLAQMEGLDVVKVKVYNLDGLTVYSTEASQIGENKSSNAGYLAARSGAVASLLTHRDTFNSFEGLIEHRDVLESYVPIRPGGSQGQIEGVIELYSDVTPLLEKIDETQRNVIIEVALILILLFGILFVVVKYADGIIHRQYSDRIRAEQALQEAHDELEVRVLARTAALNEANEQLQQEITRRKQVERQQKQRLQRLAALREIDQAITAGMDLSIILKVLLQKVINTLGVHAADVLLLEPCTGTLERATRQGFHTGALQHTRLRLGEGYAGQAVLQKRTISIPNLAEAPGELGRSPELPEEAFIAYFAVPLITKGEVKGALEVFHRAALDPDPEWLDFMETLAGQAAIAIDNAELFENLKRSNKELVLAYDSTLVGWSHALDLRDKETEGHTQRVTEMTLQLARAMEIPDEEMVNIRRGALLHDIGKMGIPDKILLKPGPLTDQEWAIMRKHPEYARDMLVSIDYLRGALEIPYCHHEKWDGSGYPRGLRREHIPLAARIFAVVDVWDALRSDRPYRKAWSDEEALAYISEQSGKHFDPKVVEVFLSSVTGQEFRVLTDEQAY